MLGEDIGASNPATLLVTVGFDAELYRIVADIDRIGSRSLQAMERA